MSGPIGSQYGHGVRWRVVALGITAFFLALRLTYLATVQLLPEEAYYWNYAQHPALGYLDHPPMVAWLIAAGTALLGHDAAGVRLGAILCWGIAAIFIFRLARNVFDKTTALRAVMLMAILPAFFGVGTVMTPDAPLVACWAGALYFFERVFFAGSTAAWFGAGACIGLGMDSKYTIALVGIAAIALHDFRQKFAALVSASCAVSRGSSFHRPFFTGDYLELTERMGIVRISRSTPLEQPRAAFPCTNFSRRSSFC